MKQTINSDVIVENCNDDVKTVSGDIVVKNSYSNRCYQAISGDITLSNVDFATTQTVSGKIYIIESEGGHSQTTSGDIMVRRGSCKIIKTVSGDIDLQKSKVLSLYTITGKIILNNSEVNKIIVDQSNVNITINGNSYNGPITVVNGEVQIPLGEKVKNFFGCSSRERNYTLEIDELSKVQEIIFKGCKGKVVYSGNNPIEIEGGELVKE